jgi:hypothetical protein
MAFVMGTGSEVFGRCVEEIDVSVGLYNADDWLCYGLILLRLIGA